MRVYVPATAADLAILATRSKPTELLASDLLGRPAQAVTAILAAQDDADQDELEWEAFLAASVDAAFMLTEMPDAAPMRVVFSLEVPDASVRELGAMATRELNLPPSSVVIDASEGAKLKAIHVDEPETAPLITAFRSDPSAPGALEKVVEGRFALV